MRIEQFFDIVLPQNGFRCLALPNKNLPGFRHQVFETNAAAAKRAYWLDFSKGEEVYFACGSLKEKFVIGTNAKGRPKKMYRTKSNIAFLRSFWFDIDCGPDKDYPTQKDAAVDLFRFLKATKLPIPLIVSSGKGLHVYWPLSSDLPVSYWDKMAFILHELSIAHNLRVDPKRSRDAASILRPVGTRHKKDPSNPIEVTARNADRFAISSPKEFVDILVAAAKEKNISKETFRTSKAPGTPNVNSALSGGVIETVPCSAHKIADNCAAIRFMRDTRGLVKEPLWYDAIGVLRHTKESPNIIHEWSCGHPGYRPDETAGKILQHENHGAGPTTCAHIHDFTEARKLCDSCPHHGNIKSPIVLGREVPPPLKSDESSELPPPSNGQIVKDSRKLPYSVTQIAELESDKSISIGVYELRSSGVYFKGDKNAEEESEARILEYPFIISSIANNRDTKVTRFMAEIMLPKKGVYSFDVDSTVIAEKSAFHKTFLKEGINIPLSSVDLMKDFVNTYLNELSKEVETMQIHTNLGWKDDQASFLLGNRLLRKNKPTEVNTFGTNLGNSMEAGVTPTGTLSNWSSVSKILDQEGMEAHALALLFGFGAPLMKMTGYDGTYVNLMGKTNAGKTTMLTWIASIYGRYHELKAQKADTYNSKMTRLASLNNIPMVIDEVTNTDDSQVSDFIYDVTQGRDKARLNKSSEPMPARTWSTIVVSSSNSSISDKLQGTKGDAEAERMRMIEYVIPNIPAFEAQAKSIHNILHENNGVAAEPYLKYVVDNYDKIKEVMTKHIVTFEKMAKAEGRERFWVAAVSAAMVGGYIAKNLGLIDFNVERVRAWAIRMIQEMREDVRENASNYQGLLGEFLNSNIINTLKLEVATRQDKDVIVSWTAPKRDLLVRVENHLTESKIFISKHPLNVWIASKRIDRATFFKELISKGYKMDLHAYKILGEGWPDNTTNAAVACVELTVDSSNRTQIGLHENVSLTRIK